MPMEEHGLQKYSRRLLINENLLSIIQHANVICYACADVVTKKSLRFITIETSVYWISIYSGRRIY